MANKRIELEQYRHYVNLIEEAPNRKVVQKGLLICVVVMTLLAVGMFFLGSMSINLASNPRNITEKPQPKAPAGATPGNQTMPNGQNIPVQQGMPSPSGNPTPVPNQSPSPTPAPGGQGMAPSGVSDLISDTTNAGMPSGAGEGDLLAQAQPTPAPANAPVMNIPPGSETAVPAGTSPSKTSTKDKDKKKAKKPLSQETKGVGSLSKLTNSVSGRGLQIYLLLHVIALITLMYVAVKRVRVEGKSK
ncbi:MAG: hypothetical protein CVT63_04620 [Candidatus Anoxymicrobium japonicum]|uniref:Uncharacterized protein n=1 Tax=Candidatus Anoxymicrobium japonicum TaxID=2013648 RepID=A0A2N3G5U0_9ACTN|nr:MAG: hypothetical protein CVT63_04620 [Candidatus Anoxymicrobium japonicum]